LGYLATGFGLLALPRMPELKNVTNINFVAETIELASIPYRDKVKEKQRQEKTKRLKENKEK
jgi:ATP-dependent RNA helicase DDX55/SPB4